MFEEDDPLRLISNKYGFSIIINDKLILKRRNDMEKYEKTFHIDEASSDEEYLYIDIPSLGGSIVLKKEKEGLVIDIFPLQVADEPINSMTIWNDDFNKEEKSYG